MKKSVPNKAKTEKTGELVFGVHAVAELLRAKKRKVISIYTTRPEPKGWDVISRLLPSYPINTQFVSRDVLTKIAGTPDHQGVLAWAMPFPFRKKTFDPVAQPFVLLLDGIQDPKNLGAIIRSAYCTGVNGIIIPEKGTAPITAATLKSAAGLAERIEIAKAPSVKAALQELSQAGYNIYLAVLENGENALQVPYKFPVCLVIGNEETGISKAILNAGHRVTLPQQSPDVSYNASVAAGILMFTVKHAKTI